LLLWSYPSYHPYSPEACQWLESLVNIIIDFHLISDDISKRGLISIEFLPITTLPVVVERKVRLISPWIEALIRMESIGIFNEINVLTDRRKINTHMACLTTLLTRHMGIDHFLGGQDPDLRVSSLEDQSW
jgi:hypothetical protein